MKKLSIFLALLFGVIAFFSCNDENPEREPSPLTPANCQGVFFPSTNITSTEIDPADPTEMTITLERTNTSGATEVPISITTNDDNVYVVPQRVAFAAGEKSVQFKVTFPSADVGITYRLSLTVQGDEYVNPYGVGSPAMNTNVTRIKWDPIPPFIYMDGTFERLFGVEPYPMYVTTETAAVGGATRYRFKNVYASLATYVDDDNIYNGFVYNDPGDYDEDQDWITVITVNPDGSVSMDAHEIGVDWGYGMTSIGSIYGYHSTDINTYPLGYVEGDKIIFPPNSLFFSLADYNNGNPYACGLPTVIYMTKESFIADNLKIDDFGDVEYEEIPGAISEYESAAYGESWDQVIAMAVDIDPENPDSEFKNLYYLPDLYATGYGLAFYYNGVSLLVPPSQAIGRTAFGRALYVSPSNTVLSTVETDEDGVTVYTIGLRFHFSDGTVLGDFAEKFYYSLEAVESEISKFYGLYEFSGVDVFEEDDDGNEIIVSFPVSIEPGPARNTFYIDGIAWEGYVRATYDASNDNMIIAPQQLDPYTGVGMSLRTLRPDGYASMSDAITLKRLANGVLVVTPSSDAIGYLIYADGYGYQEGYYDLIFTPIQSSAKSSALKKLSTGKELRTTSMQPRERCLNGNFMIQPKVSFKTIREIR